MPRPNLSKVDERVGALLKRVRNGIYLPRDSQGNISMDAEFKRHVAELTVAFAVGYKALMKKELTSAVKAEVVKYTVLSEGYGTPGLVNVGTFVKGLFDYELPSGFTLSGRIWDLGTYSQDITRIVDNAILNNFSPEMLAKQLDGFTLPGREVWTTTPYGRTLNFDSMRLARTEVINGYRRSDYEMMQRTPWVTGIYFDGSGGCVEVCVPATGSYKSYGDFDTHPQCNCPEYEETLSNDEWDSAYQSYQDTGNDPLGIGNWEAQQ